MRCDKADLPFPALPRASPAHPGDRFGDSALLSSFHTTHVQWHRNYMLGVETPLKLPPHRGYLLASNVNWAIFLPLPPSLPPSLVPLLLQDSHLAKMMKCQEEMSLQQVSSLWGISCTLIMVFVPWVVKFPSASPFWS